MMNTRLVFLPVNADDSARIALASRVATAILREYYDPIIGKEQNDYMLAKFQTVDAISEQIAQGYRYELLQIEGDVGGFLATYSRDGGLYISKFYLAKDYRGKGFGKAALRHLVDCAHSERLSYLFLNVNKRNPTVAVYEAMGFVRVRAEKNDIGGGFYMDDYVYRLDL